MTKTQQCKQCKKYYKVLEKELCYYCYQKEFGVVPTSGLYKIEKKEK